ASARDIMVSGHMLVPMVLGTSTSAACVIAALTAPATSVMCAPDDVERMAALIERLRIETVALTPWIAISMLAGKIHERYDLSSVRTVAIASASLPPRVARDVLAAIPGSRIMSVCSQSEAAPALVMNVFDAERPLAVGRPNAITELRVVGEDGEDVPS